jgi:hypothetical protein
MTGGTTQGEKLRAVDETLYQPKTIKSYPLEKDVEP